MEGTGVVLDAMREERAHTLAMQIGPAMDCLRMLSEQIIHKLQTGDSKGEVEVLQFGSCVYRTDIAKSDADLVIVLKESCTFSVKDYLTCLVGVLKSDVGKEHLWTRVTSVKAALIRMMIQPRFRGVELDIAVCYVSSSNHPQSVLSAHLRDALSALERAKGPALIEAIKLFKLLGWAAKMYNRHKECLGSRYKSISLVAWAAAVMKEVDIPRG